MQPQFDKRLQGMLVADWFRRLAGEAGWVIKQYTTNGEEYTFSAENDFKVTARVHDQAPHLTFLASDVSRQESVNALAREAIDRVASRPFGDAVWYSASMTTSGIQLAPPFSMGTIIGQLGSQIRVMGWRRLGRDVLIEFSEELPDDWNESNAIVAPKAVLHVHIAVSAPCHGYFSSYVAHAVLEVVAAICTFALGRGVQLPPFAAPNETDQIGELEAKRMDASILTLARKHVSLDIFSGIATPGGFEHAQRMRAAFLTFDVAVQQHRDSVACILYVMVAEALSIPNAAWRNAKLTKRFIHFFQELIPEELDAIVAHPNLEAAFQICRGKRSKKALRRELLEKIYDFRSGYVHAGLQPSYQAFTSPLEPSEAIRRSFFASFAEAAILGYLLSPRSSLVGHPKFLHETV